jgi:NADH-quinone oxidoreductase subunit G
LAAKAGFPPGEAKEDWAIIRAVSGAIGAPLPYDTLAQLRIAMYAAAPALARIDAIEPADLSAVDALARAGANVSDAPFTSPIFDFYLTNPIARASTVMAELSALKTSMASGTAKHQTAAE